MTEFDDSFVRKFRTDFSFFLQKKSMIRKYSVHRHTMPWQHANGAKKDGYLININPFLFLLLKYMLYKCASRYKSRKGKKVAFGAMTFAHIKFYLERKMCLDEAEFSGFYSRLERFIIPREEFCFLEEDLNLLCRCIPQFGSFAGWDEFSEHFGKNEFAISAENLPDRYFSDLPDSIQERIITDALTALGIFSRYFLSAEKFDVEEILDVLEQHICKLRNSKDASSHASLLSLVAFLGLKKTNASAIPFLSQPYRYIKLILSPHFKSKGHVLYKRRNVKSKIITSRKVNKKIRRMMAFVDNV